MQTGDYTTSVDFIDIGRHRGNSANRGFFNGAIDDLRVYDEALSQAQIIQIIPEPATILLMTLGGLYLRKRK